MMLMLLLGARASAGPGDSSARSTCVMPDLTTVH